MSNFMPTVLKRVDFDGDTITIKMKRILRKDMLKLVPFLPSEAVKPTLEENMKLMDEVAKILPGYVKDFTGLNDASGAPVTLETVLEESYFAELIGEMSGILMDSASMGDDEAKNSEGPSKESTVDGNTNLETPPE